ncbi:hypothetical protein IGI04_022322 [Brassica rapa subsp. trilocularis]|uniref:Uncharacterized protein n=1 Tax=Brassica rapa subsp. trilocularis TaxID=1813537 RepID=A0ABQ7M0N0_BRACM|nr:hypothetical protein IGI04_022322 [Brassica rapa subsp. trilocularis]
MERTFLALLILLFLCFSISSDSTELRPSASLLDQKQVHGATVKDIKGEEKEDKSIYIFRAGKGAHGHGFKGGRGGGRKASPKRNAAMDHRPQLFFSSGFPFDESLYLIGFTVMKPISVAEQFDPVAGVLSPQDGEFPQVSSFLV